MGRLKKNKRKHNFTIGLVLCLFFICNVSCGKEDIGKTVSDNASDMVTEEGLSAANSGDAEKDETVDEVAKNLICLRDGDTESLVGLSFGDEFDYDKYVIRAVSSEVRDYGLKGSEYNSIHFLFNGKGGGFSGLEQNQSRGDFLGIIVGEDEIERISDVLGACTTTKDEVSIWDFEKATLSVYTKGAKIRKIEYLAKDGIADVPEKSEEETDFGRDRRDTKGRAETVYHWSAWDFGDLGSEGSYALCDPRDVNYDENTVKEFIRDYLLAQGIRKDKPDKVTYNQNGEPLAECYVDQEKGQYCIILHIWGNWLVDVDKGTSRYLDMICCTTRTLAEEDIYGYMIYEENEAQNKIQERLYDKNKIKMADVTYEYVSGIPFPFVLESWNLNEFHPKLLIRNQKTWFFKDAATFDEDGKFIAYKGGIDEGEYLSHPCRAIYDKDGRLRAVQEELLEEDIERGWGSWDETIDYSGQIEWQYRGDGTISNVEYIRSSYTYGTGDASGTIEYDSRGRMLYNDYYITHGSDSDIYLYEEDSDMPWCVLHWCGYIRGFENIYLFLPKEK